MTSPSTLIRKAKRTKNKTEAKKLREQAARLRRIGRAAKKLGPLLANKALDPAGAGWKVLPEGANAMLNHGRVSPDGHTMTLDVGAAQQEINPLDHAVEEILKDARDKKLASTSVPHTTIRRHLIRALDRGAERADKDARVRAEMARELTKVAAVSGFIATVNQQTKLNGGPMPKVAIISGFTLARILDALADAGWSEEGKVSMGRMQANRDMVLGTRHEATDNS